MQINKLLQTVVNQGASDLILTVAAKPMLRLNGRLVPLQTKVLEPEDTITLMRSITSERCQQELQEVGSTDFGFSYGEQARFRVSVFKQRGYTGIVLRLIPNKLLSFSEIGLSDEVQRLLWRPRGLVLVTGPTGSGKTTTLATMVDYINSNRDTHIITIEDPIEYFHSHKRSVVTQRELGVDVPSFAEGLRRALRQNPDVILVGEMRDLETMETAISAAETGHLVFATLHTNSAETTINRIVDAFPPQQQEQVRIQLASNLIAVICQALIPDVSGRHRVAAFEIMMRTDAISNLIRQQKVYQIQSEIQTGMKHGMILLDDSLARLFHAGRITQEEAMNRCRNIEEMTQKIAAPPRATLGDTVESGAVAAAAAPKTARPQVLIGPAAAAAAKKAGERK
jgi:twitching motility protein PilT